MQLDYCVATGIHVLPTVAQVGCNLSLPLRPTTRAAFAIKWHGLVQMRRDGRVRRYMTIFEQTLDLPNHVDVI